MSSGSPLDHASIRSSEASLALADALDSEAALVDEAMVIGAQLDQVVERGFTASRPVLDVVGVQEPLMSAARESTAFISAA
jgi:hypothetical protein